VCWHCLSVPQGTPSGSHESQQMAAACLMSHNKQAAAA